MAHSANNAQSQQSQPAQIVSISSSQLQQGSPIPTNRSVCASASPIPFASVEQRLLERKESTAFEDGGRGDAAQCDSRVFEVPGRGTSTAP